MKRVKRIRRLAPATVEERQKQSLEWIQSRQQVRQQAREKQIARFTRVPANKIKIRYAVIEDPNTIFGSVGRCGGGYCTVWEDWSDLGRASRENIMREFEKGMNKICGHYDNLEKSILEKGMLNPMIITCGTPLVRRRSHLPPEMRELPAEELLIAEGITGGSRLWLAQKHNIPMPCIINDTTNRFDDSPLITSIQDATKYFSSPPMDLKISSGRIHETTKTIVKAEHLDEKWHDTNNLIKLRGPLWVNVMKKYGYEVNLSQGIRKLIYG